MYNETRSVADVARHSAFLSSCAPGTRIPTMAKQPPEKLLTYLGFLMYGDIGPLTLYKNYRGKLVAFQKTFPKTIASPGQVAIRKDFTDAAAAWQALTAAQRGQWEIASHRASLRMTGYNLFVHHQIEGDDAAIQTVARQTRTSLLPP